MKSVEYTLNWKCSKDDWQEHLLKEFYLLFTIKVKANKGTIFDKGADEA